MAADAIHEASKNDNIQHEAGGRERHGAFRDHAGL
jgi:hypothetical protein